MARIDELRSMPPWEFGNVFARLVEKELSLSVQPWLNVNALKGIENLLSEQQWGNYLYMLYQITPLISTALGKAFDINTTAGDMLVGMYTYANATYQQKLYAMTLCLEGYKTI